MIVGNRSPSKCLTTTLHIRQLLRQLTNASLVNIPQAPYLNVWLCRSVEGESYPELSQILPDSHRIITLLCSILGYASDLTQP